MGCSEGWITRPASWQICRRLCYPKMPCTAA
ncbi:unnamed protein product [Protopolystoma xenopodis]|uniref:Uncharacterized protein n=1 Tax=Protopolystoma xenopodis TaxID=117903 RepID=A0A3S5AS77_9PLAT|nr:unnamed protein product [Protopolystoma xenopodis]